MQKRHDPFGHLRLQDSPLERTGVSQLGFEIMTRWRVIVVTFRIYLLLSVEASVSFNCTCSSLGQIIQSSMSPGMTPLPTAHGRGRGCPPRQSGSTAAEEACRTGTHTRRPCLIQQSVDILFRPFFLCSPFPLLFTSLELAVVMTLINNIWLFFFLVR